MFCCRTCHVGSVTVAVDDCIFINNSDEPDSLDGAYVARVIDLFDVGECWVNAGVFNQHRRGCL